ncbi:DoxX family protein [Nocardioides sp. URHA0020]|uniref:DoxX family protein n=1 Tax=Nocardioides sp. URHA0020 TaxID=1380392 RepID=UPI00048EFF60|nr:DoxX family protein [Nocardioides sp. URHA0020]
MNTAAIIVSLVLALAMLLSGVFKLMRAPHIMKFAESVHLTPPQLTVLGTLQLAGALGLVAGLWYAQLAIAAAVGLVLYFAGAIITHIRVSDPNVQGAVAFATLSAATLGLLLATA